MSANQLYPLQTGVRTVVRAADRKDLAAIARIHCAAFPHAFLTALGPRFLRVYYRLVLEHSGGILLVAQQDGVTGGFVAGFLDPEQFYRRLKRARAAMLASLAVAVVKTPSLAGRIFYHIRSVQSEKRRIHPEECELSSIAVAPHSWSRGSGRELVRAFLEEARRRGAPRVYLTTEAADNRRVNWFYQRLGFALRGSFEQYRGRMLNEYVFSRDGGRDIQ